MDVQIVLMTIITFSAVITVLSFSFNLLLQPVKENQAKIESDLKDIESDLKENQTKIESDLKENQTKIESDLKDFKKEVNEKLDKLLNSQK